MTGDLVEQLRSALDEAERFAKTASGAPWEHKQYGVESEVWSHAGHRVALRPPTHHGTGGFNTLGAPDCRFVAANDPAHVLRTIQAHREVLRLYENAVAARDAGSVSDWNRAVDHGAASVLGDVVRSVAAIYLPDIETGDTP